MAPLHRFAAVQHRPRDWIGELPPWLFVAWCVLVIVRAHWPYLETPCEQSVDEGYVLAVGQRMLHGRMLPFVDGTAHTGPVFLLSGALISAFGEFSWLPVRVAALLSFAATSLLAFACCRAAKRPMAGAIAAASLPFYITLRMPAHDAFAYNAELPAIVFTLAGFGACVHALRDEPAMPDRRALGWLCAGGVFTALAALSKQTAVLLVLPLLLYVSIAVLTRSELSRRQRGTLLSIYFAACALPTLLLFVRLALGGALADAYYYLVTYNRESYMFPYRELSVLDHYKNWLAVRPFEIALLMTALAVGFSQLFEQRAREGTWRRALQKSNFDLAVSLMAAAGVLAARASMRDFDHYWVMAIPGFALLAGSLVERATQASSTGLLSLASRSMVLLPLILAGEVTFAIRDEHPLAWSADTGRLIDLAAANQEPDPYCRFVQEHSKPGESLFVWGFRPQLYVSCARLPATRYVFTSFVSGWVPQGNHLSKEIEDSIAVPGSRALLIDELEQTKPPVIIDAARTIGGRGLLRYEPIASYITAHYDPASMVSGDQLWLRKP